MGWTDACPVCETLECCAQCTFGKAAHCSTSKVRPKAVLRPALPKRATLSRRHRFLASLGFRGTASIPFRCQFLKPKTLPKRDWDGFRAPKIASKWNGHLPRLPKIVPKRHRRLPRLPKTAPKPFRCLPREQKWHRNGFDVMLSSRKGLRDEIASIIGFRRRLRNDVDAVFGTREEAMDQRLASEISWREANTGPSRPFASMWRKEAPEDSSETNPCKSAWTSLTSRGTICRCVLPSTS